MNKFFINIFALISALFLILIIFFINKEQIISCYITSMESLKKTMDLQNDLENGKIVVFGSSELVFYPTQKFLPQNYFNNILKLPLRVQGNEGQQDFAIMSQLAALNNKKIEENAKVVILLSPSWFTGNVDNGTKIPKFLEFMYVGMMDKLYFSSSISDKFKILINDYVKKNLSLIKEPGYIYEGDLKKYNENFIDKTIKRFIIETLDNKYRNIELINYKKPVLDYKQLKIEAKNAELSSSSNIYGINNVYFQKNIEQEIKKGNFPFSIIVPPSIEENQEYQHLLILLDLLKNYKIKPLIIMQDLHPYVFVNNRENMNELMLAIKSKVQEKGFEYFDMWSYKKEDYKIDTLTDTVHLGEFGWLQIEQKIINYFMK